MTSLGEYLTLNTQECLSNAAGSTLSQILEDDVPPKYFLTPKAARGILRRAAKRGRTLPERLRADLETLAAD